MLGKKDKITPKIPPITQNCHFEDVLELPDHPNGD